MRVVYADTCYFAALCNPNDQHRKTALAIESTLTGVPILTSDLVLTELLNLMTAKGPDVRRYTYNYIDRMRSNSAYEIMPFETKTFWVAARRYHDYDDKEWSLVDCYSMLLMDQNGLSECVTHDHHFEQAGFQALMRAYERDNHH